MKANSTGMTRLRQRVCPKSLGLVAGLVLIIVAFACPAVFASGGAEGGHEPVGFGKDMVFKIANFLALVAFFVYLYRKKSAGAFEKRSLEIKMEMEKAAEAKNKAEEKYREYKARIEGLDQEINNIRDLAKKDAAKEHETIVAEAGKQAEKMIKQAELTAKHEVEQAKKLLRQEAADLAAEMAAELLKKAITPEDHKSWVTSNIEKIGEIR